MGNILWKKREVRILVLGLDNAGKTSFFIIMCVTLLAMIGQMKSKTYEQASPTVGFNVEVVKTKKLILNLWDVGGQDRIRPLWKHYYTDAQALIYVIDSCDSERISQAKTELDNVLADPEMANVIVVICCNKQDNPTALKAADISEKLNLTDRKNHKCHIVPISAKTGIGLETTIEWITNNIENKK